MPNESVLEQKKALVEELRGKITGATAGVLVDYKGISVANDTKLRRELREAGVDYAVTKNTMFKLAISGSQFESLGEVLEGNTALAVSQDPVAAAKILEKYSVDSKGAFVIKAGFLDGEVLDKAGVERLAKLPSKEQLLVQLLSVLNGNIRGLAIALNKVAEQKEEPAA